MDCYKKISTSLMLIFFSLNISHAYAQEENPCAGLLSIVNRPSQSDSACAVPAKKALLEAGVNYLSLGRNHGWLLPNALVRFGLPKNNEVYVLLPNYVIQNNQPYKGFATTVAGIKHVISLSRKLITTVEGAITLPTGSNNFGSNGAGLTLNGIIEYEFTSAFSVEVMLSLNSLTEPKNLGGARYTTFNPYLVLSYQVNDKLSLYAEGFAQTRTLANQGSGSGTDFGILYLIRKNLEADIELGHRLSGIPVGYNEYIGMGMSYLFA